MGIENENLVDTQDDPVVIDQLAEIMRVLDQIGEVMAEIRSDLIGVSPASAEDTRKVPFELDDEPITGRLSVSGHAPFGRASSRHLQSR